MDPPLLHQKGNKAATQLLVNATHPVVANSQIVVQMWRKALVPAIPLNPCPGTDFTHIVDGDADHRRTSRGIRKAPTVAADGSRRYRCLIQPATMHLPAI